MKVLRSNRGSAKGLRSLLTGFAFAMVSVAGAIPAAAQSKIQQSQQILSPAGDVVEHDSFGTAAAISGNTMLIGAENADGNEVGAGAAFIFEKINNTWVQTARIFANDGHAAPLPFEPGKFISDSFGLCVAISEDANTVAVGAPAHNHDGKSGTSGGVYVFRRVNGAWIQEAELRSPFPNDVDSFGEQQGSITGGGIAISGNIIAVSDAGNFRIIDPVTGNPLLPGGVDIFTRTNGTWSLTTQLTVPEDIFLTPTSLSFDGKTLVLGSTSSDASGVFEAGVAYVFRFDEGQWSRTATLSPADPTSGAQFGNGVSVSGNSIAVSANFGPGATSLSGAAYVFTNEEDVWSQTAKLNAGDGLDFDSFGQTIAIDGQTVAVGANNHTLSASNVQFAGAAYVFRRNDDGVWRQTAEVSASDAISGGGFGDSIAIFNGTLVVGADGQHPPVEGYPGGEAYVYRLNP